MGIRVFGSVGLAGLGFEREKRSCGGAKRESVPVPVRSGRCSPDWRMRDMRSRYWYSSCERSQFGSVGRIVLCSVDVSGGGLPLLVAAFAFSLRKLSELPGGAGGLNHASIGSFSHAITMSDLVVVSWM
jgi:hypothetical protein